MRGAPFSRAVRTRIRGIIPADAGSTVSSASADDVYEDHPRGCGEHDSVWLAEVT